MADYTSIIGTNTLYGFSSTNKGVGTAYAKEDVNEVINMIDPTECPFLTSAPKTSAKSVYHHWLIDTMPTPSYSGVTEGSDFPSSYSGTTRSRLYNICQIFQRAVKVSGTVADMMDAYGVQNEYTLAVMKSTKALSYDVEKCFFRPGSGVTGSLLPQADAEPRIMPGFYNFGIGVTAQLGASTAAWGGNGQSSGTNAFKWIDVNGAITVSAVNALSGSMIVAGAKPDTLFCSYGVKAAFTNAVIGTTASAGGLNFNISGNTRTQETNRYTGNIRIFENDYCTFALVPDLWIPQASATGYGNAAYLIERSKVRVAIGRPFAHKPLPPAGDYVRGIVIGELTGEFLHPSCVGVLDRITVANY